MLKQNTEILRKEIYDLHHVVGISFSEITRQSRVHNIQKIISGDIDPTIKSWYRLHRAFPGHISKPSYTDGSYIYENTASGTGSVANSGTITKRRRTSALTYHHRNCPLNGHSTG